MDWSNERYVRLYTRDTVTWKLLGWQGKALLPLLFRKVDRAGVLEVGDAGELGVVAILEMPEDFVHAGLADLLRRGVLVSRDGAYILPNFIPAQEAPMSDRQRALESRARRRDLAMSRFVTDRHAASHDVTSCHSDPSQAKPSLSGSGDSPSPEPPASAPPTANARKKRAKPVGLLASLPDGRRGEVERILGRLSKRSGIAYEGRDNHVRLICARLDGGLTEYDLRAIVAYAASDVADEGLGWAADPKQRRFLRPETLFGPQTVDRYVEQARAWAAINATGPSDAQGAPNDHDRRGPAGATEKRGATVTPEISYLFNRRSK